MSVCLCIASRGRPNELHRTIAESLGSSTNGSIHFGVALDDDDDSGYAAGRRGPREHSLGQKYNRAASYARPDADVFVLGVDDAHVDTVGWDDKFIRAASLFPDDVGVIFFGRQDSINQLPDGIAVTRGWINKVGFFCPEYFPFWWHDTWIDELARLTGRYVWADIAWKKHGASEGAAAHRTMRIRDVGFWAKFFDDTRSMRVATARRMIEESADPAWFKSQKLGEMQMMCDLLALRNSTLRDHGESYERRFGGEETPDDPSHEILKERALAVLRQMETEAA